MSGRFSAADYAAASLALRPRGPVWPDDPTSVQATTLAALSASLARSDADAVALLVDAFPFTTLDLLPEWEASLGLPDPCAGPSPTIGQRQAQVRARFIGGGGLSRSRYIAFAAALGFTITITVFSPFRVERNRIGDPLASDDWAFAWGVNVVTNFGGLSTDVLLCELQSVAPADTTVFILSSASGFAPSYRFNDARNSQYL
ncbi:MAG: DUF2313 domain-containing protein [Sphingomonadaceae bacterium]|nr:DUF2313 domain-containing protein [Sphingomonadaceae bacterium]